MVAVSGLILLGCAAATIVGGARAIETRSFVHRWKTSSPTPGSQQQSGTIRLSGIEAVENGVGLVCFGAMLGLWGVLVLSVAASATEILPSQIRRFLSILLPFLLLILQTASIVGVFPPWRLGQSPFGSALYLTLLLIFLTCFLIWRRLLPAKAARWLLPATVIGGFALSMFSPTAPAGVVIGFFAAIFYAAHGVALLGGFAPLLDTYAGAEH